MSRPARNWLRVAAVPDAVRRSTDADVTAVLPEPPTNGQYPAWVYVLCSALVYLDYLLVAAVVLFVAYVLSGMGVALPVGPAGGLLTFVGIAAAVRVADAAVATWWRSPIDRTVEKCLGPLRERARRRYVTVSIVSPSDGAATARPTPVVGDVAAGLSVEDTTAAPDVGTRWGTHGSFPPEDRDSDLPLSEGDRFAGFELGPRIGQGSLSVVWKARDRDTGDVVALKVFDSGVDEDTRRTFEADFMHEAYVLDRLRDHEHVITLYDYGTDPYSWLAVEYVDTGTARDHLPVALPTALDLFLAVTEAIEYAHGKDVSHTDLKPENVLYSEDYFGRHVVVTDWGKRPVVNPDLEPMLTRPYAAPEQFDARPTNELEAERVDIYQLGMLAYELFTSTQPFLAGDDDRDVEARVRDETPPPPTDLVPELPDGVDDVLLTALAKDPAERYRTVAELRSALLDTLLPAVTPGEE
ncbi:MAG: serine/threonine-protein kinase [Haloarculaceae archaeon]